MKKIKIFAALLLFPFLNIGLNAQNEIEAIIFETFKYAPVGTYEIKIDFKVVNISNEEQVVFEIRTTNNLPSGWQSSLCFGEFCFPSEYDSIATAPPFPEPPVQPGDTLNTSLYIFTDLVTIGTAYVQIQVGTFSNPDERITINFIITTDPTLDVNDNYLPSEYILKQNYPNPFNPSTRINYGVKENGLVILKVYNILGVELTTLVNEFKNAGTYEIDFDASQFSSGVYFYHISVNGFSQTRKMILEK